jgi:hypothetical protein
MFPFPAFAPAEPARAAPPQTDTADPVRDVLRLFMLLGLYAIAVLVALRPVALPTLDPDIWWHLRVGQWVLEHGTAPANDPFSASGQTTSWVAYSWLYEVLVYELYRWLGLAGIIAYRVALALAVVAALHRLVTRREPRFLPAAALTAAAILALAGLFSERPWLFTILFSTLTLDTVLEARSGRRGVLFWLLPGVYALWANIHIQFVYGLFILGLGLAGPLVDRALKRAPSGDSAAAPLSRGWWALAALAGACLLATLLNPYHLRLYGVVVEYATQPGPFRFVNELKALEFREVGDWVMLALAGAAVFALGRRPAPAAFDLLLLVASAFFAFRARRDLWLLVLASLAVLSGSGAIAAPGERFALTWRRRLVLAVGLAGLIALTAQVRRLTPDHLERTVAQVFPADAARVVRERRYGGPLYNDFNWGGYLIWTLPHLPVAIDGRTNLHGDERIMRFGATWCGAPGWQDDPDLGAAGVVIAPADSALAALLQHDRRFQLVHEDEVARVFVARRTAD